MVGLGNSCRGMKSPPLLVAALIACIIVLGFNYWVASSRSVDLQVTFLLLCMLSCTRMVNKHSPQGGRFPCTWSGASASCRNSHKYYSCCLSVLGDGGNGRNACLCMRGIKNLKTCVSDTFHFCLPEAFSYLLLFQFTDVTNAVFCFSSQLYAETGTPFLI